MRNLDYDFALDDDCVRTPIVFAFVLDKEKEKERIIVAYREEANERLDFQRGEVFYDETRPLGSLVEYFETDKAKDRFWNVCTSQLLESLENKDLSATERRQMAIDVAKKLRIKYRNGEPSTKFAAILTWENYLACRNGHHNHKQMVEHLHILHRPFTMLYADNNPYVDKANDRRPKPLSDKEKKFEVRNPSKTFSARVIVVTETILPIIAYCLDIMKELGYIFLICIMCGKAFAKKGKNEKLCCSKECEKKRKAQESRIAYLLTLGDEFVESLRRFRNFYNPRIKELRENKSVKPEKIKKAEDFYDTVICGANQMKIGIERGEIPIKQLKDWLFEQEIEFENLINSND